MNLDQVVAENVAREENARNPRRRGGGLFTGKRIIDNQCFRGLGHDITKARRVKEVLEASKLMWKAVPMQLAVKGKTGYRDIGFIKRNGVDEIIPGKVQGWTNYQGVLRSDTGYLLDIMTCDFRPVQNAQLVEQFVEFAEAGKLTLKVAGELEGGRKVFCVADTTGTKGEFELHQDRKDRERGMEPRSQGYNDHAGTSRAATGERGDVTRLQFVMANGHKSGSAFSAKAWAMREWCGNGVTFSELAALVFKLNHRSKFDERAKEAIRKMIEAAFAEFETYESKCRRLLGTPMSRIESEAFVLELMQPQLLVKALDQIPVVNTRRDTPVAVTGESDYAAAGRRVLECVMDRDQRLWDPAEFSRGTNRVLEVLDIQPGADKVGGTLWNTFNAYTYDVDHVKGRSAETGVNSALFGDGDRAKTRALNLAVEYAGRMGRA